MDTLERFRGFSLATLASAWNDLTGKLQPVALSPIDVTELIAAGEGDAIEFKSTLRTNLHTGQHDDKIQLAVLKTIAGFLNAKGGTLLIGVSDSGEVLGLEADGFSNEDKMGLHLVNLMKDRVGEVFIPYVHGCLRSSPKRLPGTGIAPSRSSESVNFDIEISQVSSPRSTSPEASRNSTMQSSSPSRATEGSTRMTNSHSSETAFLVFI